MNKNYSDWFNVDLHIHSDYSNKTKRNDYDGEFSVATLKQKLIENDVALFSLTDHNIINVGAYEEYYKNKVDGDPELLVGCEFDISVEKESGSVKTYHTLLIFNENIPEKVIELSAVIEDYFKEKEIAMLERSLSIDEVFQLFHDYSFFYIPHAGGHKNIIDAYKGDDIRKAQEMVLLMESAQEKVKEAFRPKILKGFDQITDLDFRERNDIAFINFSDNHCCTIYPTPKSGNEHEFYCLKGDPSYETLRFALIDPSSRIRKASEVDQLKNVKKHISGIKIESLEGVVDSTIEFSPNLNVIIGGASSGKSLLFNLIGLKTEVRKHKFSRYKIAPDDVKIRASTGGEFQDTLPFNPDEIVYINQGDVVKFFEEGNLKKLVDDSDKQEEFEEIKDRFQQVKTELLELTRRFAKDFDHFNDSYQKDFVLREGDILNILSDKFHLKEYRDTRSTINYEDKNSIIENVSYNLDLLRKDSTFELTEDENSLLDKVEELLTRKSDLITTKDIHQDAISGFVNQVINIISEKNESLESTSRAKNEAIKRREILIEDCANLFSSAASFLVSCDELSEFNYAEKQSIQVDDSVSVVTEVIEDVNIADRIIGCIRESSTQFTVFENYMKLIKNNSLIKHLDYSELNLSRKLETEFKPVLDKFNDLDTHLDYGGNGNSKDKSPGFNAEMYLKTILQQDNCKLVMIDQPEDNLGNSFKNEELINLLRDLKFKKQIILVTHNPSVVVYGDAECIILADNDMGEISYRQLVLENKEYQKMIIDNLDGGKAIFDMRSRKYNIKKLLNS